MKKALKIILFVVLGFIAIIIIISTRGCISGCNQAQTKYAEPSNSSQATVDEEFVAAPVDTTPTYKWTYSDSKDEMTEKEIRYAFLDANNEFEFGFPYEGGSKLKIMLRRTGGTKNEVMLQISKGQFMGNYNSDVKVKFDAGPLKTFSFSEPGDATSNIIFLNSEQSFISQLKKSKHVKIQAPYYQEGQKVAEFDTEGLEW